MTVYDDDGLRALAWAYVDNPTELDRLLILADYLEDKEAAEAGHVRLLYRLHDLVGSRRVEPDCEDVRYRGEGHSALLRAFNACWPRRLHKTSPWTWGRHVLMILWRCLCMRWAPLHVPPRARATAARPYVDFAQPGGHKHFSVVLPAARRLTAFYELTCFNLFGTRGQLRDEENELQRDVYDAIAAENKAFHGRRQSCRASLSLTVGGNLPALDQVVHSVCIALGYESASNRVGENVKRWFNQTGIDVADAVYDWQRGLTPADSPPARLPG